MSEITPVTVQSHPVQAVQFIEPYAAVAEWAGGHLVDGIHGGVEYMYVENPGKGSLHVPVGSWVLKDAFGQITVVSESEFAARYTAVKPFPRINMIR